MVNGILIAILLILLWIVLIYRLAPAIKRSRHFSLLGPALMVKSPKNRGFLDKFSKIFPKEFTSRVAVAIVLLTMVAAFAFLFYEIYLTITVRVAVSEPVSSYLALPGINPFIPIFYGTMALIIGVVIHEIMHGVISRKHNITVRSVGALFFVIPVGAFVEPDEKEITEASPVVRRRIFAAGPATNIVLSFIFFILLIMIMAPMAQVIHNGDYLESTQPQISSLHNLSGSELISFGNYSGENLSNIAYASHIAPGTVVNFSVFNGKSTSTYETYAGVAIDSLLSGFPAYSSSLRSGDIIVRIQNSTIYNINTLNDVLDNITPGTNISVYYVNASTIASGSSVHSIRIITASKYSYYEKYYPLQNSPSYRNQSFLGISVDYSGLLYIPMSEAKSLVFGNYVFSGFPDGFIGFIILPLEGLSPVPQSLASLFSTPLGGTFWIITNSFYWLFWINFLLGLTNALPLFILDGGQFFKDTLTISSRHKSLKFLNEKRIRDISNFFGALVFLMLLWILIVPRIG
ncbi:MAG: site-2 protease family protein [Candidatus Thermoplasmatota archaeon]|nr:site-2 protease family protein [Candidatus Thermoplasmatota archaeon]MCL5731421.1 site-2 protease family protein [Candidatus Thermoplasmatota archaeon]